MRFEPPSPALATSFAAFRQACVSAGDDDWTHGHEIAKTDPVAYAHRLAAWAGGEIVPEWGVPATTFWITANGAVVAECDVRHRLTARLEHMGGHIGYIVHPQHRGCGIATFALRRCLEYLSERGEHNALLTCADTNLASIRVIEKCGGKRIEDSNRRRYTIALPIGVTTQRLRLRPFRASDADAFYAFNQDPDVRKFIGAQPLSMDFCRAHMERCANAGASRGYSQCAIVRTSDGRLIGRGGINMLDELQMLEVSWVIARPEWGNGYATEAGRAGLSLAFDTIGSDIAGAPIHPGNVASRRVAEKLGMHLDALVDVYGDGVRLEKYVMTRERWRNGS